MGTALHDVSSGDHPRAVTTRLRAARAVRGERGISEVNLRMKTRGGQGRARSTVKAKGSHDSTSIPACMTRHGPSVCQYFFVRLADNISVGLLMVLTLLFAALGLLLPARNQDGAKWALDAAKLCLWVLLGMFARGKRA